MAAPKRLEALKKAADILADNITIDTDTPPPKPARITQAAPRVDLSHAQRLQNALDHLKAADRELSALFDEIHPEAYKQPQHLTTKTYLDAFGDINAAKNKLGNLIDHLEKYG